jgi:hypothetical protein
MAKRRVTVYLSDVEFKGVEGQEVDPGTSEVKLTHVRFTKRGRWSAIRPQITIEYPWQLL